MIKPTVGRIVWFYTSSAQEQPQAAVVCHVWSDELVNLAVFDSNGVPFPKTSVHLYQGEGERPTGRCFCEWMPYQINQAKKTEEA